MNNDIDDLVATHQNELHKAPPHLVHQWHNVIDQAATVERGRSEDRQVRWRPSTLFWSATLTAAVALGIAIGVLVSDEATNNQVPKTVSETPQVTVIPAAFSRGLQYHLRDSQQQLADLETDSDRTLLVLQLIEQNRLFESAADQNNAPKLARVLRAFEPILLRLAATDIAPEDAEALRAQLSFELNVMLTKLANDSSDESHST